MMKRILSLLLALLMVVGIFPAPAHAEDNPEPAAASLETTAAAPCTTCGKSDCDGNHPNWCTLCQVDDCGKTHVWCETCQKYDCGVTHVWCETCQKNDCGQTHVWCEACQKYDCGQNHCPTCGTIDCTREHKACPKCGTVDCGKDHTNWCADCQVDDCGKSHVWCETCQKNDCGKSHTPCDKCSVIDCTADHTNWCASCGIDNCGIDHSLKLTKSPLTTTVQQSALLSESDPMVGRRVKIASGASMAWPVTDLSNVQANTVLASVSEYAAEMVVMAVATVSGITYYQLKAADGYSWPEGSKVQDGYWLDSTKLEVIEEKTPCPVCGKEDCTEKHIGATVTDSEGNEQKIVVSGDALPEGARLEVTPIEDMEEMIDQIGWEGKFVWDIKILDKDGNEWKPTDAVELSLPITGASDDEYIDIVHFLEDHTEIETAIEKGHIAGGEIVSFCPNAVTAYKEVTGEDGYAAHEIFEGLQVKNGYVSFLTNSFSIYTASGSYLSDTEEGGSRKIVMGQTGSTSGSNGKTFYVTKSHRIYMDRGGSMPTSQSWSTSNSSIGSFDGSNTDKYFNLNGSAALGTQFTITYKYRENNAFNGGIGNKTITVTFVIVEERTTYFNANGGSCSPSSAVAVTDGNSHHKYITLPKATRTGYTPTGWYTAASGGTKIGDAGASYMPASSGGTLYAQWTANNYTVTFNANNGSVSPAEKTVTYDSAYGDLPTPTRTGFRFLGWYTAASGGTQVTKDTVYKTEGDTTLYARWEFDVQISDGYDGYLYPAGAALPSGCVYRWSKMSGTYDYDVTTWTNSWSNVSAMNGNAVDVLNDGGYVHENSNMTSGTKYQYRLEVVSGSTVIGTAYYTVNYGIQILNSSFEIPDVEKYSDHVFYWNDHENLFWKSTAPKEAVKNGQVEIGGNVHTFYNGKKAIHGDQFAELNADMAAALYQDVFTEPNTNLTWAINHTARETTGEDEMYVLITSSKSAVNITNQDQIDAIVAKAKDIEASYTDAGNTQAAAGVFAGEENVVYNGINFRIWRCVSQFVSTETWTKYAGQYQVPANQKMTRFFFSAGNTATNNRTVGNLLDAVYFDESIHYVINYYRNGELLPAMSEAGVAGPGDVVKATKVGELTANDAAYLSAIYWNNAPQTMVAEPSITMDASRGNVLNLYFISQHKVTLDQTDVTTQSNVTKYYYRFNTTAKDASGNLIYYYTQRACTTPMVNGTGEGKYYTIVPPQRTGYKFGGYYTEQNGQGTQYIDQTGKCVNNIYQNVAADSTLYAKWIPQYQYTLTFHANGENVAGMPGAQSTGWIDDATKTFSWTQEPTRTGYAFQGWAESATATTASKTKSTTVTGNAADMASKDLYAIWLPIYTVEGKIDNGGTITVADGGANPQSVVSGQNNKEITFTPATGYKISGVKVNDEDLETFDESSFSYSDTITENTVVEVTTVRNVFTITFTNWDDSELESKDWTYGATPSYDADPDAAGIQPPSRPSDAQYHYKFAGWTPAVTTVTGEATYKATYTTVLRSYTITWKNDDGSTIDTTTVQYGDMPSHADPSKSSTAEYTYTFSSWTPALVAVTGDATYTANYTATRNQYEVTFVDEDGTVLKAATEYDYGTPAADIVKPADPKKTSDAQYDYKFAGWSPAIQDVTGQATYKATYTSTVRSYMVTWVDGDGKTLQSGSVPYNTEPVYSGATPTKTATDQYTYTFNGKWSPEITAVTGDVTYTAQFDQVVNKYTVTWVDGNGNTLKTEQVAYGVTPVYSGDDPTKTATAQYTYTWSTENPWSPAIVSVTGDATYIAQFDSVVNKYTITWIDGDGNTLKTEDLDYGVTPKYTGKTPTKTSTEALDYTFSGSWSPAIVPVEKDATYTAQFTSASRTYTVTWWQDKNGNGTMDGDEVLHEDEVAYNTKLKYEGPKPSKEANQQYWYNFEGWKDATENQINAYEEITVTGDVTYQAILNPKLMEYNVTWLVEGVEKEKKLWKYGETPTYSGETPTKAEDDGYTYQWDGEWTPVIVPVEDEVKYEAIFTKTAKKFQISYELEKDGMSGTVNGENPVEYTVESDAITLINPTPAQPYYQFNGWTGTGLTEPTMEVTIPTGSTGDRAYTANYALINYTIHFDGNGAAETNLPDIPYKYGDPVTLPTVTKTGHTYEWKVDTQKGDWTPGEKVESGVMNHYGDVTLKAEWTPIQYKIQFHGNAAEVAGTTAELTMTYDVEKLLTANGFTRDGYHFLGWSTDQNSTTATYADQESVKNLAAVNEAVVNLYAVWKLNTVSLIIRTVNTVDNNQSYIFDVTGRSLDGEENIKLQVVLAANDEQTIVGLPAGTYTVADQNGWSWRYEHMSAEKDVHSTTVIAEFGYSYNQMLSEKVYWLNGYGNEQIRTAASSNG